MEELLDILQELHPEIDYDDCDTLIDEKYFDSFDIISIVTEINNTFDVTVPAEELTPENFNSAEALWDLIVRLQND